MDTNVKKSNNKIIVRIICLLLGGILIGSSAVFGIQCLSAMINFGPDVVLNSRLSDDLTMYDCDSFYREVDNYLTTVTTNVGAEDGAVVEGLSAEKAKIVSEKTVEFNIKKAEMIEDYLREYSTESYYDEYDYYFENDDYTVPDVSGRDDISIDEDAPKIIRDVQTILCVTEGTEFLKYANLVPDENLEDSWYSCEFSAMVNGLSYTYNTEISFSETEPEEAISAEYESFIEENEINDYSYNSAESFEEIKQGKTAFKYYIVNSKTKKVYTNLADGKDKNYIVSLGKYYSCINGKVTQYGYDRLQNYSYHSYFDTSYEAYVGVDVTDASEDDVFYKTNAFAQSMSNKNIAYQFSVFAVCFFASIALVIIALVLTPKKLMLIDKIYTDVHFLASVFLTVLGASGIVAVIEYFYSTVSDALSTPLAVLVCAFTIACYALVCEFLCSFARICKSDKRLRENILIYRILRWFYRKVRSFFREVKSNFFYREKEINKTTKPVLIALFCVHSFLLLLCTAIDSAFFQLVLFLLIVLADAYLVRKILNYAQQLDKIIVSAKERTDLEEDLNSLPTSLCSLANSLKYTNNELKTAVEKAVKDERLKSELITNVSHDLKTPLTSIITYVDLLSKCDIDDEKAKEYIAVLDEKGEKLKRLIEDLIEASKVSSGNITLNMVTLDLSELATQACGETYDAFTENRLELVLKPSENPVSVVADGNKTFRVIENLLSNAKKYSAANSRVYASIYEENGKGVFEIKNISAEPLDITPEELTERFVRGDKARTNEGNGLGLSIAKELCTAMGGTLELSIDGDLFKAKIILNK